jgi:PRC-barrel domain
VLQTYDYEQLRELSGHAVVSQDGDAIGYVDLVFRDVDSGEPEWLGIWDGLPDSKPRVLVPIRGVDVEGNVVRVPGREMSFATRRPTRLPVTSSSVTTASSRSLRNGSARHTRITASTLRPSASNLSRSSASASGESSRSD